MDDSFEQRKTGIKVHTPWGPFEIRGLGAILTLVLVANVLIAYMVWEHTAYTKGSGQNIAKAMDRIAISQREFSCIISKDQEERRVAFQSGECRRQARIGSYANGEAP